jgi:asparagine synthase (glutamine-hydrolysing)
MYRGVRKLPPAHTLVLEDGAVTVRPYWEVDFGEPVRRSDDEAVGELLRLMRESVRAHLVSDRPLGVLLSGGIDSSAVTAFAAEAGGRMKSFSVGFGAASQSEARFARAAAARFGTDHVEVEYDEMPPPDADGSLTDWFDEPFGDPSALPTALVCRVAREGVTVALSGDGGDELFGGYRRYGKFCRWSARDGLPRALRGPIAFAAGRMFPAVSKARRTVDRWGMDGLARHARLHGGMAREDKRGALPAAVLARFRGYDDYWSFRPHWRADLDPWSRLQYVDLKTYLPDDLLTKVDRVSMQVSLEVRPPLLDHRIVEFAATVPTEQRATGGERKRLLKTALAGILGPESLDRGKQGFSPPPDRGAPDSGAGTEGWPAAFRSNWACLRLWTRERLGVPDPREILREGP